jgi:hypothetical protein
VYDEDYEYDSGLLFPDERANKALFAINRTAENIQLEITGSNPAELMGYQVEYAISGQGVL